MGQLTIILCTTVCFLILLPSTHSAKNDITFLVDTTTAVSQDEFNQIIDFIYNITSRLTIGLDDSMVALVTFDASPTTKFDLNDISDKASLLDAIMAIKNYSLNDDRETSKALDHIGDNIYVSSQGLRTDAESSLLLVTYGQSKSPTNTQFSALVLKFTVQTIYVIGIGSLMYEPTERIDFPNIASSTDNIFYIEEIPYLCHYISNITIKLDPNATQSEVDGCPAMTTTSTTITTTIPTTTEMETTEFKYSTVSTNPTEPTYSTDSTYSTELIYSTEVTNSTKLTSSTELTYTTESTYSTEPKYYSTESTYSTKSKYSTEAKYSTESLPKEQSNDSAIIILSVISVVLVLVTVIVGILVIYYLSKYRKRKRRLELITVLAREYPDMANGLGPSRMKYIETKHEYKNGHSNKFHTFLKLSMMNNGTKIVSR